MSSPPEPDATHRLEVPVAADRTEAVSARLTGLGALGVWEREGVLIAWFPARLQHLAAGPDDPLGDVLAAAEWSIEPDRDWQAEWKATIAPVRAGRTVVVPTWLADDHESAPGDLVLVLDPGRAFGSGHHATTTLCLEILDDLDLAGRLRDRTLTDVGCGSGILAIAAAARGARAVGVDIDPAAVTVTQENAARNGVEVDVRHGSVEVAPGSAGIVVANLVTDVVAQLAGELLSITRDTLVVSGITIERQHVALDALDAAGFRLDERRERNGWLAVAGHRDDAGGT